MNITHSHDPDTEDKVACKEETDWEGVGPQLQVLGLLSVRDEGAAEKAGVDQLDVPVLGGDGDLRLVVTVDQESPDEGEDERSP